MNWGTLSGLAGGFKGIADQIKSAQLQQREDEQQAFANALAERRMKLDEENARRGAERQALEEERWQVMNTPEGTPLSPETVSRRQKMGLGEFIQGEQSLPSTSRIQTMTAGPSPTQLPALLSQSETFLPSAPTGRQLSVAPQSEKIRVAEVNAEAKRLLEGQKAQQRQSLANQREQMMYTLQKMRDSGADIRQQRELAIRIKALDQQMNMFDTRMDFNADVWNNIRIPDMLNRLDLAEARVGNNSLLEQLLAGNAGIPLPSKEKPVVPPRRSLSEVAVGDGVKPGGLMSKGADPSLKYFDNGNVGKPDGQGGFDLVGRWK